jgi:hypothetical protein
MLLLVLGFSLLLFTIWVTTVWIEGICTQFRACFRIGIRWGSPKYSIVVPLSCFKHFNLWSSMALKSRPLDHFLETVGIEMVTFLWHLLPQCSAEVRGVFIFGTGDAATTGILSGIVWQVASGAEVLFKQMLKKGIIEVKIRPDFESPVLDVDIHCIVFVPLLHIITAVVHTIWRQDCLALTQGGRRLWQNIPFKD